MTTPNASPSKSTSTFRARNRRRTNEDDENASLGTPSAPRSNGLGTSSTSSFTSHSDDRARRSRSANNSNNNRFLDVPSTFFSSQTSNKPNTNIWETSWSSLQSVAADLFRSDTSRASSPGVSPARRNLYGSQGKSNTAWGPRTPADKELGAGTEERRRMELEAKKRERLLLANGHLAPGYKKRRDSDDIGRDDSTAPEDRDTLAYLHRVKQGDTLAGVAIRYNCHVNTFRKANRFWPNDSIQIRKTVVLPVDACGIRGRKVADEEVGGWLQEEQKSWTDTQDPGKASKATSSSSIPTSPSITSVGLDDPPWQHDSWVRVDGFPEALEIVRMSRKTLGYFPRSRRKSLSFSDAGASNTTPPASFELSRSSFQQSPLLGPTTSPSRSKTRSRNRSGSASYFSSTSLHGPGGVGTMSKNVRSPGPANDGLNKMFPTLEARVAPLSSSFESLQQQHMQHGHHYSHSHSLANNGNGLENMGGAIEGWVRKMASRASNSLLQPPAPRYAASSAGGANLGNTSGFATAEAYSDMTGPGGGELIELSEDAFELGSTGSQEDSDSKPLGQKGRQQEELEEDPFAPRGRVFMDSSLKSRGR